VVADKPAVDMAVVGMVTAMYAAHMVAVGMTAAGIVGPIHLGGHCPEEGNGPEVAVAASGTFQHQLVRQPRLDQGRKNPRSARNGDRPFYGGGARRYG
jgi:transcriptional regulator GlxA family with amidase domain